MLPSLLVSSMIVESVKQALTQSFLMELTSPTIFENNFYLFVVGDKLARQIYNKIVKYDAKYCLSKRSGSWASCNRQQDEAPNARKLPKIFTIVAAMSNCLVVPPLNPYSAKDFIYFFSPTFVSLKVSKLYFVLQLRVWYEKTSIFLLI